MNNKICCKCEACKSICPVNAIAFEKNEFFEEVNISEEKCLNCNICDKVCPMNDKNLKTNIPKIHVAKCIDKKMLSKSSSGGIFASIAKKILTSGGVVYGAAYNKNFGVDIKRVDNIKGLSALQGSKYVKSNMNDSIKQVEKDLNNGMEVLFSATACYVHGLLNYLRLKKVNTEKLYTVDLVCHGLPSNYVWQEYIKQIEKDNKSKLKEVNFRYYDGKDITKNFLYKFENGKKYHEALYENVYGKAFLTNMIFDDNCYSCKYSGFHNQSDITLGDAHGYNSSERGYKHSLILTNTKKGERLFNLIGDCIEEFNDYDLEVLLNNNYPLLHPSIKPYNAFKINKKNIIKNLNNYQDPMYTFKPDKKGVGILNFHYENYNYGANLVPFALSKIIKNLGYNPYVIDFDPFDDVSPIIRHKTWKLLEFRQKHLILTPRFKEKEKLTILNDYFDRFVVGSDQVWRKTITSSNVLTYFLDFVNQDKIKLSYGASFGNNHFEGTNYEKLCAINLLKNFNGISVREKDAIELLEKDFGINSTFVLDPTLLLSKSDYEEIIDEEYQEKIDVAVYFVMDFQNTVLENESFKRLFKNKKIVNIKGSIVPSIIENDFIFNSISKWIDGIRKCEYLVTDSYHGVLFGILFNKKIICIGKNSAALSRFNSVCSVLGGNLEKINYSSLDEVKNIDFMPDYEKINVKIKEYKEKSIKFLKDSLRKKYEKKNLDLEKAVELYQDCLNELQKDNNNLNNNIQSLENTLLQKEDQINHQQNIINQQEMIISNQLDETNRLENENNKLKTNQQNIEREIKTLTNELNKVLSSKSWKITKPLRYVVRKVKRHEK